MMYMHRKRFKRCTRTYVTYLTYLTDNFWETGKGKGNLTLILFEILLPYMH